jgi:hypothetical protein
MAQVSRSSRAKAKIAPTRLWDSVRCTRAGPRDGRGPAAVCCLTTPSRPKAVGCYRLLSSASYGSLLPDLARPRDTM